MLKEARIWHWESMQKHASQTRDQLDKLDFGKKNAKLWVKCRKNANNCELCFCNCMFLTFLICIFFALCVCTCMFFACLIWCIFSRLQFSRNIPQGAIYVNDFQSRSLCLFLHPPFASPPHPRTYGTWKHRMSLRVLALQRKSVNPLANSWTAASRMRWNWVAENTRHVTICRTDATKKKVHLLMTMIWVMYLYYIFVSIIESVDCSSMMNPYVHSCFFFFIRQWLQQLNNCCAIHLLVEHVTQHGEDSFSLRHPEAIGE